MACLLGVQRSFHKAEVALREVAGWRLDDETIRRACHEAAEHAGSTRERRDAAVFARAGGEPELHVDAGKVNTTGGWRDVKLGAFARREPGEPTTAAEWDGRDLPPPSARSAVAAVEEASAFGDRCAAEARRLGLTDFGRLQVLGDGAEWIWNLAGRHFPGASQCLDFWHAAGYLGAAASAALGPGSVEAAAALGRGKGKLLGDGYRGVEEWVGELAAEMPPGGDGTASAAALNYLAAHRDRLNYALRLRRGRAIGSGLAEGSIKQLVNVRMKQTGAKWKVEHVAPLVELGALAAGPEWDAYWKQK